jgi:hypothetical protein
VVVGKLEVGGLRAGLDHRTSVRAERAGRRAGLDSLARVCATLTRCRSCGRDTTTTGDWRCTYCGQPKALTAEPVAPPAAAADYVEPLDAPEQYPGREEPRLRDDLRPQLGAAAVAALIAIVGLIMGSELLLIAAAAVLVVAVVAKIVSDGW